MLGVRCCCGGHGCQDGAPGGGSHGCLSGEHRGGGGGYFRWSCGRQWELRRVARARLWCCPDLDMDGSPCRVNFGPSSCGGVTELKLCAYILLRTSCSAPICARVPGKNPCPLDSVATTLCAVPYWGRCALGHGVFKPFKVHAWLRSCVVFSPLRCFRCDFCYPGIPRSDL